MSDDLLVTEPTNLPANLFGTTNPDASLAKAGEVAKTLMRVVQEQNLWKQIGQKKHIYVDAWTFLGSMLGVFPNVVWTKRVMDGDICLGWEARVEARTLSGQLVGSAEASCLYAENNWKNRDDFALRSMSQTRATGKAMRLPLGFIAVLAGYASTPAEEMPADEDLTPALKKSIEMAKQKKADAATPIGDESRVAPTSKPAASAIQSATGLSNEEYMAEAALRRKETLEKYGPQENRRENAPFARETGMALGHLRGGRQPSDTVGPAGDTRSFEEKLKAVSDEAKAKAGRPIWAPDFCECGSAVNRYDHVDDKTGKITGHYWECAVRRENRRILYSNNMKKPDIRKHETVSPHFIKWELDDDASQ